MNEQIKKLAEQAFRDTVLCGGKRGDKDFDQLYNERFAELIVRECIELNKQELSFNAFERMLNRYKEHFGVEE